MNKPHSTLYPFQRSRSECSYFPETSQNPPDFEASDKFDAEYEDEAYEAKIAQLLKRVYARDKQTSEGKALWKKYLDALANEDFYGLVMVDQAGIPH